MRMTSLSSGAVRWRPILDAWRGGEVRGISSSLARRKEDTRGGGGKERTGASEGGWTGGGGGAFSDSAGLGPRRFYKNVDVVRQRDGLFYVSLDGKPVRTPQRRYLATRSEALAIGMALEWDLQAKRVQPASMPLTGILNTAIDIIPNYRNRSIYSMLRYLDTDAVCYRSHYPDALTKEQERLWDPVLSYIHETHGVLPEVSKSVVAIEQPEELQRTFAKWLQPMDNVRIAALEVAIASSKSFTIGVALYDSFLTTEQAVAAARCDEEYQARVWGEVEGGHDMDRADLAVRLASASTVFQIARMDAHLL